MPNFGTEWYETDIYALLRICKTGVTSKMKINKKGISPVIATVIIVAVAIAVAIAVAYWVTGIIPAFTRYEELKISTSIINHEENATVVVKNTGSADATLDQILVNGRLNDTSPGWDVTTAGTDGLLTLKPGDTAEITVYAKEWGEIDAFQSGVVYDFTVHTAGGGSYPASARAP